MSYKMVEQYTADMAEKDVLVFMKTDFQHVGTDAKGKRCVIADNDNYVYAIFPNRKVNKDGTRCECYLKPEGNILSWKGKLKPSETLELDALAVDVPAAWDEYSDLLTKMVVDGLLGDSVIVVEDAGSWQKMGGARKRALKKQIDEIIGEGIPKDSSHNKVRRGTVYPLVFAA